MQLVNKRFVKTAPTEDDVKLARNWCLEHLGFQDVDLSRLSDRDGLRTLELLEKLELEPPRRGLDWQQLDARERKALERLLRKAMGVSEAEYEAAQKEAEGMRYFAQMRAEGRRRKALSREETGDFFRAVHFNVAHGHWHAQHVALFVGVAAQLAAGEALGPFARVEGTRDDPDNIMLVYSRRDGPVAWYGGTWGGMPEWPRVLDWLVENTYLRHVDFGRGPEVGVALGKKGLKALGGPTPRPPRRLRERLAAANGKAEA
jgi:hypothetical protein